MMLRGKKLPANSTVAETRTWTGSLKATADPGTSPGGAVAPACMTHIGGTAATAVASNFYSHVAALFR